MGEGNRRERAGVRGKVRVVWCLRNNYTFAAMDFGRRLGASDEHIPKWICKERATTPPPKRHAALRVALKLAWGFVARRSSIAGDTLPPSRLAPSQFERNECISYFGDTTLAKPGEGRGRNEGRLGRTP